MNPYTVSRYLRDLVLEPAQDPEDLTWHDGALCAQADPEEWYPEKGGSSLRAKAVCRRCPSRLPCLDWALSRREPFGIWGGLSYEERERVIPAYARGAGLPGIAAAADADQNKRRAVAAEHGREAGLARRREPSSTPQPREQEAA